MPLLNEFSIQLFSLRDIVNDDFAGTLEKLGCKGFGYTGVEFFNYGGLTVDEMKKVLSDNKLRPVGSHVGLARLENTLDEEIAFAKAIGVEYIFCPSSKIRTRADTLELAGFLTTVTEKVIAAGMKFGYHNHDYEFIKEDGEYLLDILFENLPPEAIMELDIFWSDYAGVDSMAYMEKHKSRLEVLHVKQIDKDKNNVELSKGIIDFADVITKGKAMGVKEFILEFEEYDIPSLVAAENDIKYIFSL